MLVGGDQGGVSMHGEQSTLWVPLTEADKEMVRQQMNRLLETSHFKNSRRYPALLRFIIEETLEGRGKFLKERLIGVNVFGRPTDYDTATDPIVRITIAEIRKRIAQYYQDDEHEHEMRIKLLTGCYEPEFHPGRELRQSMLEETTAAHDLLPHEPASVRPNSSPILAAAPATPLLHPSESATSRISRRTLYAALAVLIAAAAAVTAGYAWRALRPSPVDELWGPILASHQPVLFCLPVAGGKYGNATTGELIDLRGNTSANSGDLKSDLKSSFLARESLGEDVVFSDVLAMTRISDFLSAHHVDTRYRLNTAISLDDLRQGPVVLVGGMDNQWTLRQLDHLRYRFGGTDQESYWILDTKTGKRTDWSLDTKTNVDTVKRDYALIARVHDGDTNQIDMVVAGIGMSGTAAAGELLVNPQDVAELRRLVGPGFRDRDFEAVISTDVVNGIAGSPKILTVVVQ